MQSGLIVTQADPRWFFEREAAFLGYQSIAGVDEAGRGPLAGPVVAAACILPSHFEASLIEGIDDSKKVAKKARSELFERLSAHPDVYYGIGIVDALIIDQINILQATFEAMVAAVLNLKKKADYLLIDGSHIPPAIKSLDCQAQAFVSADERSFSVGAASILAKETRDRLMNAHHREWPQYGFDRHKGYGTREHVRAIKEHGVCPIHRLSFAPCKEGIYA